MVRTYRPGRTLKEFRRINHDMTQTAAARLVRTSQTTWGRIENGDVIPRRGLAKRIARLTGIPIARIMGVPVSAPIAEPAAAPADV